MKIGVTPEGRALDPGPYLAALPTLSADLPEGARSFATDPEHYDFSGRRCVKDLSLASLAFIRDGDDQSIELTFRHNCWKHEEDLTIRYEAVTQYEIALPSDGIGDAIVMLDEILPHPSGCHHEIGFLSGTITVTSRDLTASWLQADCPDR
ncbi:hypothetical protein [Nonomuraea rhodomycinica]|uniref:hypothetical protein n=1 Tax=Nonomuraea rhodomycinica TaxID=1712872 RepID=UPI001C37C42D|nr:hypothetical protein [Nonomuraea rhodomycinica]